MKKLAFLGGAAGLGLMALLGAPITQAADHADAPAAAGNPMADINDVYAWMTDSGANISLAMTVAPFDDDSHEFGPSVQYVFHLTRNEGLPASAEQFTAGEESKIICTFASNTSGECWVVDPANKVVDYVKGDFSATDGVASADGKLKVFAGPRSDPFFFNLAGFLRAQAAVEGQCGPNAADPCPGDLQTNAAGCPNGAGTATLIKNNVAPLLSATAPVMVGPCPADQKDCFENANVMALVLQLDKTLVTTNDKQVLGVWGSTHAGQ